MELQVGVKALLRNPEGRFLLVKRDFEKYRDVKGAWDIVGGRIEPGTRLLANLKREIREETGLELTTEPKLVAAQDILRIKGRHVVRLTYAAVIAGEPKLDKYHTDYKWLALEEMKNFKDLDIYLKELLENGTFDETF